MKTIAIYNPYLQTRGGGERLCLSLAEVLSKKENVRVCVLTYEYVNLDDLAKYFQLDLSRITLELLDIDSLLIRIVQRLKLPCSLRNFFYDRKNVNLIKEYNFDIFINHCYHSNLPNLGEVGFYMCMFPQKFTDFRINPKSILKRAYRSVLVAMYRLFIHRGDKQSIYTYDHVLSISEFTSKYIQKYWSLESELVYPVCEDMKDEHEKKKIILHAGRFFERRVGNHHKRQDSLLDAFSELKSLHKVGWELHFVGSVADDTGTLKYILDLLKKSQGLPVKFHFNAEFSELKRLFNEASIYWHATGYGINKLKHPEMQEHFGITTVEAMSTGCIPIVYDSGGQRDIITKSGSGYTWNTLNELISLTSKVANIKNTELKKLQEANIKNSKIYNQASFIKRINAIFSDVL